VTVPNNRALSEGGHNLTATSTDTVGLVSASSAVFQVTIDRTAPTGTVITSALTDTGATASVLNNGTTKDDTLVLTGKAEAGAMVRLFVGSTVVGTTTADASGNWAVNYTAPADGTVTFTARAFDLAGLSQPSATFAVTVDKTAPVPVITGAVATKTATTVSGTADTGSTIKIYQNGIEIGTRDGQERDLEHVGEQAQRRHGPHPPGRGH
jgi:hypothetical protein